MIKNFFKGLIVFGFSFSAFAQEGVEETSEYLTCFSPSLVYTYTPALMKQKAAEAPGIVKVITEDQISSRGYRTVMDVLCDTVGISADISNEFIPLIKLRGSSTTGSGILFLLNGQKLNNAFYDGMLEFIQMQTDQVKQVEIVRGPGGMVWGEGAFEGIVNIITKQNLDNNQFAVSGAAGNDRYKTGNLFMNYQKDSFYFNLNYDYYRSNQYQLRVEKDQGDFIRNSPMRSFFSSQLQDLTPGTFEQDAEHEMWNGVIGKGDFKLEYYYSDSTFNIFGGNYFLIGKDHANGSRDYYLKPRYVFRFAENWECETALTWQKSKSGNRRDGFAATPPGFGINMDYNGDGTFEYWPEGILAMNQVEVGIFAAEAILSTSFERHDLKFGLRYEKTEISTDKNLQNFFFIGNGNVVSLREMRDFQHSSPFIPDKYREVNSFYSQDSFALTDQTSLVAGLRFDDPGGYKSGWTPRAGLIHHFSRSVFKLLYGEGFRLPSFFELYMYYRSDEDWSMGNPNLDCEKIKTLESSFDYEMTDSLEVSLNVFYTEVTDKILQKEHKETLRGYKNLDPYRIMGFESEVRQQFERISFFLQYAYTRIDRDFLEAIDSLYPLRHSAGAGFDATPLERTTVYFGYYFEGETERYWQEDDLPSAHYANMSLTRTFFENTRLSLSVYNAFYEKNYYSGVKGKTSDIERPGRTYTLRLQYSF